MISGLPSRIAQRLQGVERRLVDEQLAGAAAGDLGRREVRPAPGGGRHVAPVGVEGHGVLRTKEPAEWAGGWEGSEKARAPRVTGGENPRTGSSAWPGARSCRWMRSAKG